MTFNTSLEITNDPNDFVPALKVKEWEKSILADKPSKIKLSSNLQMTVLLKLHRTGKLCYQECQFFGTPVEVFHCGYVYEPHGLGLGMAYSESLMSDMSPPKEYNINGSVEIVISDNPSDCTHENDYKEWLQGIVSESTAVDRPVVVTITEPEQLCMLKSLKGSSGIIIKRIQIGDESVNMTINKDGYCIPEQENDSLEHFSNILIVEQMEAF